MQCEHHCLCKGWHKRFRKRALDVTSSDFEAYPDFGSSKSDHLKPPLHQTFWGIVLEPSEMPVQLIWHRREAGLSHFTHSLFKVVLALLPCKTDEIDIADSPILPVFIHGELHYLAPLF